MIPQATIEEIRNRMDIVDVVGDFVSLKRSGSSYKALSPFTNEKTPSFYVVPSKGIFKDFSSNKGGDVITFLMEMEGMGYVDAIKYLAKRYGIEIKEEETDTEWEKTQKKTESLYIVLKFANTHFQKLLHESNQGKSMGLSYLLERKFELDLIKKFELGYADATWDNMLLAAEKLGYNVELLEEAGLIVQKEHKRFDRFRGRCIFPIHSMSGKPIGFAGRKLSPDDKSAKYINSPETLLYNKSKVLYGMYQAKNAIRKEKNCYLVEGYTDVIAMHQATIENVVASSGTSLTEDQVRLIKRYTENVTVLYDGDPSGIRAALRGIDMFLQEGLNVKAVALPLGEDPDSCIKQLGKAKFKELLHAESQDIIRFKIKILQEDTKQDPAQQAEIIQEIVTSITKMDNPLKRSLYIKECSQLLEVPENTLIALENKILLESRKKRSEFSPETTEKFDKKSFENPLDKEKKIELQEQESIRILINYGNDSIQSPQIQDHALIEYFLKEIEEIHFTNPVYHEILSLFKKYLKEGKILSYKDLLHHPNQKIREVTSSLLTKKHTLSTNWKDKHGILVSQETDNLKDLAYSNILRLKFRILQQHIAEEREKLKNVDDHADDEILNNILNLKQIEKQIAEAIGNVIIE